MFRNQLASVWVALSLLVTTHASTMVSRAMCQDDWPDQKPDEWSNQRHDEWHMIDEDELIIEEVSRNFVSHDSREGSGWSGGLSFLALARNDDIDILWGAARNRSTFETDLNSGLQIDLTFEPDNHGSPSDEVRRLSLVAIQGEGSTTIFGEDFESAASVYGGIVSLGTQRPLLRGRSRLLMGLRYLNIADRIDVLESGRLLAEDWVRAANHVVTIDGTAEGIWYWKNLNFSSSASAGIGGNLATQSGWLASGTASTYEANDFNFSSVVEFRSSVGLDVSDHIQMHVGLRGLVATGVQQVRGAYGGPDEPDTVRLVGMTFGIEQAF